MPAARILVSILNWNGTPDTLACLAQLAGAPAADIHCVVLDNGSTVDPSDEIRRAHPQVEVLREPHNLGFTGGHNLVMALALQRGHDSVLLLNNDCKIDSASIRLMQSMLDEHAELAAVSPLIYCEDAPTRPQMVGGWLDWQQHRSTHPSVPGLRGPAGSPTHVLGTALLLRCAALREIGLLDERYFAYYEDNDLSARIAAAGWAAAYCDGATALHRARPIQDYSAMSLYLSARNAWLFWSTHTPPQHRQRLVRHLLAQHLLEIALLKKNGASADKAEAIVAGFWDARRGRSGAPPKRLSSPWLLRRLARAAPYFLRELILSPAEALRGKLGLARVAAAHDGDPP